MWVLHFLVVTYALLKELSAVMFLPQVIAVLLGLIYLRLGNGQADVMNINGILFLLIMNMTMTNVFSVANVSIVLI